MISVVIPTTNRPQLLRRAVESAAGIGSPIGEVIIVYDCDDDQKKSSLDEQSFSESRDTNIRVFARSEYRPDAKGAPVARNIGLRLAQNPFVLFLDDDDVLDSEGLRERFETLRAHPDLDFVTGPTLPFRKTPRDIDQPPYRSEYPVPALMAFLAGSIPWMTSGPLWRAESLSKIGAWNESLIRGQDIELHIRALATGLNYRLVKKVAYHYCIDSNDQMSSEANRHLAHKAGYRISTYRTAIEHLNSKSLATEEIIATVLCNSVDLALRCRLAGGNFSTCISGIRGLRSLGWVSQKEYRKIWLALRFWFSVFGKIPSRRYLMRGYLPEGVSNLDRGKLLLKKRCFIISAEDQKAYAR